MGRSRGGLTTKIHALVDAEGRPVQLTLSEGQAHDGPAALELLGLLKEGDILLADKAYDSNEIREQVAARGAWANIPPKKNRSESFAFSAFLYRERNLVERFFNKIKHFRAIATRYEKYAENYLALVKLASIRIWLRFYESTA
jgi:transposase